MDPKTSKDLERLEELKRVTYDFFNILASEGMIDFVKILPELAYPLFKFADASGGFK